jgi:hypothetical protein
MAQPTTDENNGRQSMSVAILSARLASQRLEDSKDNFVMFG